MRDAHSGSFLASHLYLVPHPADQGIDARPLTELLSSAAIETRPFVALHPKAGQLKVVARDLWIQVLPERHSAAGAAAVDTSYLLTLPDLDLITRAFRSINPEAHARFLAHKEGQGSPLSRSALQTKADQIEARQRLFQDLHSSLRIASLNGRALKPVVTPPRSVDDAFLRSPFRTAVFRRREVALMRDYRELAEKIRTRFRKSAKVISFRPGRVKPVMLTETFRGVKFEIFQAEVEQSLARWPTVNTAVQRPASYVALPLQDLPPDTPRGLVPFRVESAALSSRGKASFSARVPPRRSEP